MSALVDWIYQEIIKRGGKIEQGAAYRLAQIVGPDLWRASLEIDKLCSYRNGKLIRKEDIELLVKEEIHPKIFSLIDALGERNTKRAHLLLSELLSLGENESYILSMIAYQIRNLLIIKDLLEKEKPLNLSGLHPFVLEKTRQQSKNFTKEQLKNIYGKLLETDYNIKTGRLKPYLALDLLIAGFLK
jgi:DNA polymerase-3 subunit delta